MLIFMKKLMVKKSTKKTILKFIVTSALVFFLIEKIDWLETWEYLRNMRMSFVLGFVFFYLMGILISARKWQILANFKEFKKPYFFYVKNYFLGTFFNNFLPSFIGGDAYRIHSLGEKERRFKDSSVTVVVDRVSGLLGVVVLAATFGIMNSKIIFQTEIILCMVIAMVTISIIFLLGVLFFDVGLVQIVIGYLPKKVQFYVKQLGEFRKAKIFWKTMNYSFLFVLVGIALANYMLFRALGVELSFFSFLSVTFLANIIASLPISMGNIGIKEWAYIMLFSIFGVSASALITIVIIARILQMCISLLAIPFYLQNKHKS